MLHTAFLNTEIFPEVWPHILSLPQYHLETENLQVLDGLLLVGKAVDELFQCLYDRRQCVIFGFCLGLFLQLFVCKLVQELGDNILANTHLGNSLSQINHTMLMALYLPFYYVQYIKAKDSTYLLFSPTTISTELQQQRPIPTKLHTVAVDMQLTETADTQSTNLHAARSCQKL